ncbi:MAG TPA: VOC family protein [Beutenbergiaceae bacterium]|nr:VOC family protein [Beutenbergiaceae bacterium]
MFTGVAIHGIYVLDHEEALDFYVGKLGMEVTSDVDMGFMRWVTVALPADPDRQILLEVPGPPSLSDDVAAQVRDLVTKGALGAVAIFNTDDCHATYATLRERDVEFTQEPVRQPYGIDCALRDPFGNHIRITQMTEMAQVTDADLARWESSHQK